MSELSLSDVKLFLKADGDEDDPYIILLIDVAKEYIQSKIGECDLTKARVRVLILNIIATLYVKRQMTIEKNDSVQYVLDIMIAQLQMEHDNVANEIV